LTRAIEFDFKIHHRDTEAQRERAAKQIPWDRENLKEMVFSVKSLCLCVSVVGFRILMQLR
jgi:hypothetical protein